MGAVIARPGWSRWIWYSASKYLISHINDGAGAWVLELRRCNDGIMMRRARSRFVCTAEGDRDHSPCIPHHSRKFLQKDEKKTNEVVPRDSPTAAFRLPAHANNAITEIKLNPHAMMSAMFPSELLPPLIDWLTRGIPHSGFMPIGADEALDERPVRTDESSFCSCQRCNQYTQFCG